jgi:pimeloyl-ACP methyl ester carboxylesterase
MVSLAPRFRVLAPDLYGSGKSANWPSDRTISLKDEVAFIEPVLPTGDSFSIVGHSHGAAVGLMLALAHPRRVRALALYEPTLFSLLEAESPPPNAVDGIRQAVDASGRALDQGHADEAAKHFIDYWMGPTSWENTPQSRRAPIVASIVNVRRWGHALLTEPTELDVFRTLDIPVLYMVGKESTPSALGVARLLTQALPRVEVREFEGLGHMGPVTHPQQVNEAVADFLSRQ